MVRIAAQLRNYADLTHAPQLLRSAASERSSAVRTESPNLDGAHDGVQGRGSAGHRVREGLGSSLEVDPADNGGGRNVDNRDVLLVPHVRPAAHVKPCSRYRAALRRTRLLAPALRPTSRPTRGIWHHCRGATREANGRTARRTVGRSRWQFNNTQHAPYDAHVQHTTPHATRCATCNAARSAARRTVGRSRPPVRSTAESRFHP